MKTKNGGFSFIELLIVIALISIAAALLIPHVEEAQLTAGAPLTAMLHVIAEKGINSSEPVHLTDGWYYISDAHTNANGELSSFIQNETATNQPIVNVYTYMDGSYGNWSDSWVIIKAARELSITNGYFVHVANKR